MKLATPSIYNSIKSETATFQRYCPFFLRANTRWDSLVHTVTQAFRHSLAHTHTISVTLHYMVLGWISGLETYQISKQGALPPHPQYCLSTTILNCFLFAIYMSQISTYWSIRIGGQTVHSQWCQKQPDRLHFGKVKAKWHAFLHGVDFHVNSGGLFQSRQLFKDPPRPTPFESVVSHMNSTCRLVKNLN